MFDPPEQVKWAVGVMTALNRALFPYRHPRIGQPLRAAGKLLRKIAKA